MNPGVKNPTYYSRQLSHTYQQLRSIPGLSDTARAVALDALDLLGVALVTDNRADRPPGALCWRPWHDYTPEEAGQ